MRSGRQREAAEIVRYKKASSAGRLLLGEIDGPLPPISIENYLARPRRQLILERDTLRESLRGEIAKFCRDNFESLEPEDLSKLYDVLVAHGSDWFVPLVEFEQKFGRFRPGVLKGAPLHSTVRISPLGLQTDYPEHHLFRDVAVSLNEAIEIEERRLTPYRTKSWREKKSQQTRPEIADLIRRRDASLRSCVLSCFNLVEAYINGLAWAYVQTHDVSSLSQNNQNVLTEARNTVNIVLKLTKIPGLVTGKETGPLDKAHYPLSSFIETVKPYRDAIVHASPFTAPEKFGGYDKLSKLYELDLRTAREAVDTTAAIIKEVHHYVDGASGLPPWFLPRRADGTFVLGP